MLNAQRKAVEAEAICREMLEVQRAQLGPDHPEVGVTLNLLAKVLFTLIRYPEAVKTGEQLVALQERIHGANHPATADALASLAIIYHDGLDRYDDAVAANERAHRIYQQTFGPDHPRTLRILHNLAIMHHRADRLSAAEAIYRQLLEAYGRTLGEAHPETMPAGGSTAGRGRATVQASPDSGLSAGCR